MKRISIQGGRFIGVKINMSNYEMLGNCKLCRKIWEKSVIKVCLLWDNGSRIERLT